MASASKGNCYLCGKELSKGGMKTHILKMHGDEGTEECYLLKIEGKYDKNYWMHVDMPLYDILDSLDQFLRDIWLECCGHMSAFNYRTFGNELNNNRKIRSFDLEDKLLHEYDFGSTTETIITIIGKTKRDEQIESVRLLSRNVPPDCKCQVCGNPADYICTVCMYQSGNHFLCQACSDDHEHADMLLPTCNSPRMGVCGYCGEQDTYQFEPEL